MLLALFPIKSIAQKLGGAVYFAPLRLRLGLRHYREPDLLFLLSAEDPRNQDEFWLGADLVIEIVSEGGYERDFITKRREYAHARIHEYWLIDPFDEIFRVLTLTGQQYVEHGTFTRNHIAASALLPELRLDVNALFDAK
jgi:Uma2 family endonuclease